MTSVSLTEQYPIESQTTDNDKLSLSAIQNAFARPRGWRLWKRAAYRYLEVGSHLGGSLVPHLANDRCAMAFSVDPRPRSQPDERGIYFDYDGNSTQRMVSKLREVLPEGNMRKLRTFDMTTDEMPLSEIGKVDLALIDGEHTNRAAFADFLNLEPAMARHSAVVFHDANLVIDAILNIESLLKKKGRRFELLFATDIVAVIAFGAYRNALRSALTDRLIEHEHFVQSAKLGLWRQIALSGASAGSP